VDGDGGSARWRPTQEAALVDGGDFDGARQLQGGKWNNKAVVIQRERPSKEMLTGKGKKAVVLGGSLPEKLRVARVHGCGEWLGLPIDGEL
jgi:hypothetical protein